jgi:hypothetical protein
MVLSVVRVAIAAIAVSLAVYAVVLRKERRLVGGLFISWTMFWGLVAIFALFWDAFDPLWIFLNLSDALHALFLAVVLLISLILLRTATLSSKVNDRLTQLTRSTALRESNFDRGKEREKGKKRVAVVIPTLNGEKTLASVINRISLSPDLVGRAFVVDDGSTDDTPRVAADCGAIVIQHALNLGQGGALKTGFLAAEEWGADIVVCLDSDGEHFPEDMMPLIRKMEESDLDMVVGSRFLNSRPDISRNRKVAISAYSWLVRRLTDYQVTDATCGLRVIRARYVSSLMYRSERSYAIAMLVMAHRARMRVEELPVHYGKRVHGQSQFHDLSTWFKYPFSIMKQLIEIYF